MESSPDSDPVLWESGDGRTQVLKIEEDLFELIYDGNIVMEPAAFHVVRRYHQAEFA